MVQACSQHDNTENPLHAKGRGAAAFPQVTGGHPASDIRLDYSHCCVILVTAVGICNALRIPHSFVCALHKSAVCLTTCGTFGRGNCVTVSQCLSMAVGTPLNSAACRDLFSVCDMRVQGSTAPCILHAICCFRSVSSLRSLAGGCGELSTLQAWMGCRQHPRGLRMRGCTEGQQRRTSCWCCGVAREFASTR